MTNAQSIVHKLEEAEIVFDQQQVDIGIITESWFSNKIHENYVNISGYNLFSKPRGHKGGGGVATYVHEDIPATVVDEIVVPPKLECMWFKVWPKRVPRNISVIAICAVYITTKSPYQNLLADHRLLDTVDYNKPFLLSPFGKSDHVCVIWKSNLLRNSGKTP